MKNLYLVYDYLGPSEFFYNSTNPELVKNYFKYNLEFHKDVDDKIFFDKNVNTNSSQNIFFEDIQSIHISDLNKFNYKDKNNTFLYFISTGGRNEISLGIKTTSSVFQFISKKYINYLTLDNFYICINFGLEHEMPSKYFSQIYKELQSINVSPTKLWILSNNFKNIENNQLFLNKFNLKNISKINFIVFYEQLRTKATELLDKSTDLQSESDIHLEKKKYALILNRRLHLHRLMFLGLLINDGLLDKNLVSFDIDFDLDRFYDLKNSFENHSYINVDMYFQKSDYDINKISNSYYFKIKNGINKIEKIRKKILDVTDFNNIEGRPKELDDVNLYKDTNFSLVAETEFFERFGGSLTEKILKPIQQLHPFVILGPTGSLKYLKSYGFKTFSDFWDESYDDELIHSKRLLKVYETFSTLCNKSKKEWMELNKSLQTILIHNRNHLKNFSYKNDEIIFKNLKKYLQDENNTENTKLLQTP